VNGSIMSKRKKTVNRRAFLYGAGGIAIGLPFLEGMPERSAWAQNAQPIFTFFMCAACGVEPKKFWPSGSGELKGLLAGKSVEALAPFADNLLIVKGVDFPLTGPTGCGHAQGLAQALTAKSPTGNGGLYSALVTTCVEAALGGDAQASAALQPGGAQNNNVINRIASRNF